MPDDADPIRHQLTISLGPGQDCLAPTRPGTRSASRHDHPQLVVRAVDPAVEAKQKGGDDTAHTRRMLAFIEERVREMPDQYFWAHKRFKTGPPGDPNPYKKKRP